MKKIALIFGTRPEAIKMCPLVLELQKRSTYMPLVCVTGQHRQMLDQVLQTFGVKPIHDLNLMRDNQSLSQLTGSVINGVDAFLAETKPDAVLVQGDTTTVMAAAIAAFYHQIPVGHVEAGLRTGNIYSPWPEEGNRIITGHLARWHFCPTETSRQNLLREGVDKKQIFVTGNTVIDALLMAEGLVRENPPKIPELDFIVHGPGSRPYVLITGHRRENFGEGFVDICLSVRTLAEKFPGYQFVYPVHLNPNVRKPVGEILGRGLLKNIHLIEPQSYLPFIYLLSHSRLVLTDSGGVQEEAPSLGKPVLVMRNTTERPEAVEAGTVRLVGTDRDKIVAGVSELLMDSSIYDSMAAAHNPYGDGQASCRIADILEKELEVF